jgi:cobalt-zinc-cadmium efflux system protein
VSHSHEPSRASSVRRLGWTLALVIGYMGAEVAGGVIANSLALLADAGHMLSDAASLALALVAIWIARRPRTAEHTYGYHRAEILAALANGAALVAISVFIVVEAWHRFTNPPDVRGGMMMAIAGGGLAVNLAGLWLLHGGRGESLNVRGAWLHVLTDTLGSVQAMIAGGLIWAFGWRWLDPVASVLIALLVVWSSWSLLRDSVNVLLEGAPAGLDTREIEATLFGLDGIAELHDLHVWTITSGFVALSVHVVPSPTAPANLLWHIREVLRERFDIEHSTIQIEDSGPRTAPGSLPVRSS